MNKKTENVLLAVGAHPDDMDFGASGTIAKFASDDWDVYYVLCTDGSRGSDVPEMTHAKLAQIRRDEQVAAGKILGVKDIFFLEHSDTQLEANLQLKEELVRIIRRVKPKIVITMDPTFYFSKEPLFSGYHFINHTDHRAAALATMDAVFPLSRDRLIFPEHEKEGLGLHAVEELWLTCFEEIRHTVDITETIDKKLEAIAAHKSQYDDFPSVKERMMERAKEFAKEENYHFAENFTRLLLPPHRNRVEKK
jgi:LmbE family N-acetylglucosaminyl deacetylase